MKKEQILLMVFVFLCGCEGFRYPATEAQKENAWLHLRTTQLAAEQASSETVSETLQGLSSLAVEQSQAFVADYGMPTTIPADCDTESVLSSAGAVARQAQTDGTRRIDPWSAADGLLELGIGIAGLLGGAYGVKAAGFLTQARQKAQALKEIVQGNEIFKQFNAESVEAFKEAQKNQNASTRQLVAELKTTG